MGRGSLVWMDAPTYVLASTVVMLAAVDAPLPVEVTALGMVALILRFLLRRDNKAVMENSRRLDALEESEREQRHLKHVVLNQITAMRATLAILLPTARQCSCGTMEPLLPVIERLSIDHSPPERGNL